MSVGNRIIKHLKRIDTLFLQELKNIPVAVIGDASSRLVCTNGNINSMNQQRMIGQAYTVKVPDGDNLLFYYAIANAKKGDIIVVSGNGFKHRALCGGIMASLAQHRKLGGFLIDGAIRDIQDIKSMRFPVFASGICPNGPYKNGPGEINVPVVIDGVCVEPGDVIVADEEGIAVIPLNDLQEVITLSKKIMDREMTMIQEIKDTNSLNLEWMYQKLEEIQSEILE